MPQEIPECQSCSGHVSGSSLKQSALENHSPGSIDGDIFKHGEKLSDRIVVPALLLDLDGLNEEVVVQGVELEADLEYPPRALVVPALLLHLGIFEPSLIGVRLQVGDELEQDLGLLELALAFGEVG